MYVLALGVDGNDRDIDGDTLADGGCDDTVVFENLYASLEALLIWLLGRHKDIHCEVTEAPATLIIAAGGCCDLSTDMLDAQFTALQTEQQASR